jgi:hypothetical protein
MLKKLFIRKALQIINKRPPDFVVGEPHDPYMLRWWAIRRNKFFNIYIHAFLKDDDDRALHDHPWPSLSLLCKGKIFEYFKTKDGLIDIRRITAGSWTWRPASFAHRIAVPNAWEVVPVTIFITGPRIREWGFHCPQGWRHWKDFVGINKGEVGKGCGED